MERTRGLVSLSLLLTLAVFFLLLRNAVVVILSGFRLVSFFFLCNFFFRSVCQQKVKGINMDKKEQEFMNACFYGDDERTREIIAEDPYLVCTAKDDFGHSPAFWAVFDGNMNLLQYMTDAVFRLSFRQQPREQAMLWRDVFERGTASGYTPVHASVAKGYVECLAFLVEHCSVGASSLEARDDTGTTPTFVAISREHVEAAGFIIRHAPSGIAVITTKTHHQWSPLNAFYCLSDRDRILMDRYLTPLKSTCCCHSHQLPTAP
jgi:hypothetical protein